MQKKSVSFQWWLFVILKVLLWLWNVASNPQYLLRRWKLLVLNTTVKTAPAAAVDVLGAVGERGVREKPPLPDPSPDPPPPPLLGDTVLDPGVDKIILSAETFLGLTGF